MLSPTAFSFGADYLSTYEEANAGVHLNNMAIAGEFSFFFFSVNAFCGLIALLCTWYLPWGAPPGDVRLPKALASVQRFYPARIKRIFSQSGSSTIMSAIDGFPPKRTDEDFEMHDASVGPAVEAKNLRKVYDDGTVAVNNVDIAFHPGEVSVLLGHNGAGKSTFLSCLTGLLPVTSGHLTALGCDLTSERGMRAFRRHLGVCPQGNVLFANLTVTEHLLIFGTIRGLEGELLSREVASKIKLVGLEAKANAFAQNLSGGQKRKLCIAMAFVNDPQCVVLDEPTSGVDPVSRRQLWELIRDRARSSQNVVLMTTHFMDEANLLGDRISILSKKGTFDAVVLLSF